MTTQMDAPTMTLADLERLLVDLGFPLEGVRGVEIVAGERGVRESGLFLRVLRRIYDHEGKPFGIRMPDDSVQVAADATLIPLTGVSVAADGARGFFPLAYNEGICDQPSEAEDRFFLEQRLQDLKAGRRFLRPPRNPEHVDGSIGQ